MENFVLMLGRIAGWILCGGFVVGRPFRTLCFHQHASVRVFNELNAHVRQKVLGFCTRRNCCSPGVLPGRSTTLALLAILHGGAAANQTGIKSDCMFMIIMRRIISPIVLFVIYVCRYAAFLLFAVSAYAIQWMERSVPSMAMTSRREHVGLGTQLLFCQPTEDVK